jgi:hypothetical protein
LRSLKKQGWGGSGDAAQALFPTHPPSAAYGWGTRKVLVGPLAGFMRMGGYSPFAAVPSPFGFDFDSARLSGEIVAEAAPWPVLGLFDEIALDRVAMDIAQFFDMLFVREDVEVVVADLPELLAVPFEALGGFALENVDC